MWARIIQGLLLSPLLANSRAVIWFHGSNLLVFQLLFFFLFSRFGNGFGFSDFFFFYKKKKRETWKRKFGISLSRNTQFCLNSSHNWTSLLKFCRSLGSKLPFRGGTHLSRSSLYSMGIYSFVSEMISRRNYWIKPQDLRCARSLPHSTKLVSNVSLREDRTSFNGMGRSVEVGDYRNSSMDSMDNEKITDPLYFCWTSLF